MPHDGCGTGGGQAVLQRLNVRGCVNTIRSELELRVAPIIISWIVIGVIVLIMDILMLIIKLSYFVSEGNR